MGFKQFTMTCAAAAVMAVPATRATADSRDFAAGIVAGVIGSAVVRNANKPKRTVRRSTTRTYKKKRTPTISNAARAQNREVQTSLNYFGFPAGSPDGVLGRNSRAAISNYQAHLGYPATGQLTQFERDFLTQSYHRAIAGGAATTQAIAGNPLGPKGLLNQYRDQAAGVTTAATEQPLVAPQPSTTTTVVAVQPQVLQPQVLATQPTTATFAAAGGAAAGAAALPNFLGATEAQSLASHCNEVMLVASTNGYMSEVNMTDGPSVLREQICLARNYAITQGDQMASAVKGFTPQQIEAQCAGFGPALAPHVASLAVKPADQVVNDIGQFVQTSGMAPAQLAGTAKICLSVGYRTDNMDVAVGSGLLLASLGEPVYGELMGHHLSQGFGVTQRVDLSQAWYQMGLDAIDRGATPVFNPGDQNRTALIRRAVFNPKQSSVTATPQVQPAAAAALPTFNIQN